MSTTTAVRRAARPDVVRPTGLRLVPRVRIAPSQGAFVLLVSVLLGIGLLGLLALNTVLAQGSFVSHDLSSQLDDLRDREQALQQQVAALESPEQLAKRARALGMVPGVNPVFLRTSDAKILGVPTPARKPAPKASTTARTKASAAPSAKASAAPQPPAAR